ncbi:MAG: Na/Pi cotransporter family protein [Oscillospiraceae bacterium]|nr:Na/Pi cotransporter family protein [Oscillospiraceae bacterium]
MDIFSIITLLGGLAFFLYGMKVMSDGLEKSANGKLTSNLNKITKNRFVAMIFGAGMTVAVQSSSAVTVMLVGLVNSGLLEFGQTIGVLMGSNIGTTLTAWILSLAGIDSDVVWLNLLKPKNFAPLFALSGIVMTMISKKEKFKSLGNVLIGFAILMFGMELMSGSMEPLADMPEFQNVLTAFSNPFIAVIIGAVFTGIIQSSAASVAILQALSLSGGLTYGMAIPIIMGQNIGTCVTAIISSIGVNRNAKKVAVVHLSFNILGTLICLIPFCIGNALFDWAFTSWDITPIMIAIVHSIFNILTTAILLPFAKQLEKIANFVIRDKDKDEVREVILDERTLSVPTVAVNKSFDVTVDMCMLAKDAFLKGIVQMNGYTEDGAAEIDEIEKRLDMLQDLLSTYMMKLSKIGVSEADSKRIAKILHTIDDFERIGDHAVGITKIGKELHDKKTAFSPEAHKELEKIAEAVTEILNITAECFRTGDLRLAGYVEPLDQVIDNLILTAKRSHIIRLQHGVCTKELGFALSDVLTSFERTADHCSNVAVAVIEAQNGTFDTHEYLHYIKHKNNESFMEKYDEYLEKFSL